MPAENDGAETPETTVPEESAPTPAPETTEPSGDEPVAVADEPVAVADEPVAVADEPVAVPDEPVAVVDAPVAPVDAASYPAPAPYPAYTPTEPPYATAPTYPAGSAPFVPVAPLQSAAKGFALAALILGIAAFVLGWTPVLGFILGAIAVVFGIIALVKRQSKGMAITGLALGVVAAIASIVMSFAALAVIANWDDFVAGWEEGISGEAPVVDEGTGTDATDTTDEVDLANFTALDDAGLAAIVADPESAAGQTHIVYGEIQQLDDMTGTCSAAIALDDSQQASWEGYATVAWLNAESGVTECPEFDGLEELSHIKAWVTVVGTTPTEFDDGTTEDVLTFELHQYEALPALP